MIANSSFLLEHNWQKPVKMRRAWRTSVQESINGSEKRSGLFSAPVRSLFYTISALSAAHSNYIKRKLYKNLHQIWALPFWQDETVLTAQALSGQSELPVESTGYFNFEAGAPCIIYIDENNYEIGEILTVAETLITLKANLANAWSAQTKVYPMLQARIKPVQKLNFITPEYSELSIFAQEVLDTDIEKNIGSISGYPEYNGKYVFDKEPDWKAEITSEYQHKYKQIKSLGKDFVESYQQETQIEIAFDFLEISRPEIYSFESFFDGCMGRLKLFWIPSHQADITVLAGFVSTDTILNIQDIKWTDYWAPNAAVGYYLFFRFPDETQAYRKITGATDTTVTLDTAIGKTVTANDLPGLQVSFLLPCRFNTDEIETIYHTQNIAEITMPVKTLPIE